MSALAAPEQKTDLAEARLKPPNLQANYIQVCVIRLLPFRATLSPKQKYTGLHTSTLSLHHSWFVPGNENFISKTLYSPFFL
jgi:hypothetical protein